MTNQNPEPDVAAEKPARGRPRLPIKRLNVCLRLSEPALAALRETARTEQLPLATVIYHLWTKAYPDLA